MANPGAGHVIAVVGGKGGVGKSVFAANLALTLCLDRKMAIAAVDADIQGSGDLNLIFGIKEPRNIGNDLVEGKVRAGDPLKRIMAQVMVGGAASQTYALQLLQNLERVADISEEKMDLAMRSLKSTFPVTIVDCGSRLEGGLIKVLEHASIILVVTNPEILVLNQTKKIIQKLQTLLFPPEFVKIVLNKFTTGNPYNGPFLEQTLKRQVLSVIPEEVELARTALGKGQPMVSLSPNSATTRAYVQFARQLFEGRILEKLASLQKPRQQAAQVAASNAAKDGKGVAQLKAPSRSAFGREPQDPK
ncbi:MAG: P-loop NTPase [Bdellovibrionota bacterium]